MIGRSTSPYVDTKYNASSLTEPAVVITQNSAQVTATESNLTPNIVRKRRTTITTVDGITGQANQLVGSREASCISPMPRRKQARPRRRSGECGPNDGSQPNSPEPNDTEVCDKG